MKILYLLLIVPVGILSFVLIDTYKNWDYLDHENTTSVSTSNISNTLIVSKNLECDSQVTLNKLEKLTPEQNHSAISLAEKSDVFQRNVGDMNYTVISVGPNYSFDSKTCSNFVINGVGVYFKLSNGSSLDIFEDGKMSKVVEVKVAQNFSHGL